MFLGHYAAGLAAKKAAPEISLGTLFLSVQLVDLLWPMFLLVGLEHVRIDPGNTAMTPLDFYDYPFTHSLLGAIGWSVLAGAAYFGFRRSPKGAGIVGALVFSHWVLDLVTHRPDLPLGVGGEIFFGLGLWNSVPATVAVEAGMFIGGVLLYSRATRAVDRVGNYAFWCLVAFLGAISVANLLGPPPPDAAMIAIAGHASWLFVIWAYWVDRHRKPSAGLAPAVSPRERNV